jgi:PEP-CTERM motif
MTCLDSLLWRYVAMRMLRFYLPACLLLIGASTALADGAPDPKITLGGGGSCQSFSETSLTQTFTGVETGCAVDFTNNIPSDDVGVTLDILVVNVLTPFSNALSCALGDGAPLNTATVSSPTSCTFQDVSEIFSITPGSKYSLTFEAGTGFPSFLDITLSPNVITTPEPATMLLLGTGLVVLSLGRKRVKVAGAAV